MLGARGGHHVGWYGIMGGNICTHCAAWVADNQLRATNPGAEVGCGMSLCRQTVVRQLSGVSMVSVGGHYN